MRLEYYESGQEWLLRLVGEDVSYKRLVTNGDGACALHAAFGECGPQELKCENARNRAAEGILKLHMSGGGNELNKSVYSAIWSELAGPAAEAKEDGTETSNEAEFCGTNYQSFCITAQSRTYANGGP